MRFMVMHKVTEELEKGLPPDPEAMAAVEKLIGEAAKENIFQGGEGLKPTAQRLHIHYKDGKRTVTDGPFTEAKELVAGFALMRVSSRDEAIAWSDRFAVAMGGNVEMFLGPVVEYWDLGFGTKPENAPLRFLAMHKADERSENDLPPDPEHVAAMMALIEEMTKAGVLEATGGLASTKKERVFDSARANLRSSMDLLPNPRSSFRVTRFSTCLPKKRPSNGPCDSAKSSKSTRWMFG